MKCLDVEIAVANLFDFRRHLIVPNVGRGMDLHECDILVVRKSGYAIEVEIKVSKSDLKKDQEKRHGHESNKIKELYFAVPEKLLSDAYQYVPSHAGIIAVNDTPQGRYASFERVAAINKNARPMTEREMQNVARLGTMRIWGLKKKLATAPASVRAKACQMVIESQK